MADEAEQVRRELQRHKAVLDARRELRRTRRGIEAEIAETKAQLAQVQARAAAAEVRGASLAEVQTFSATELRRRMQELGVGQAEVDRVTAAMVRAASRLVPANDPSELLIASIKKATERALKRELQHITKDLIRRNERAMLDVRDDTLERWVSVQDNRVCEDCQARHGAVQTHAQWLVDGEPGGPNTICNGACRCKLVPDAMFSGPYEREPGDVKVTVSLEVDA